jgi:nucleoside-diphosphate-sugar epimerase
MTQSTVLILGANGRFGSAAVRAFAAAGWKVLAQVRRAPVAPLPAGAVAVNVALDDAAALTTAAKGVRAVVYAVNPLYTRWEAEVMPLARQGLAVAERLGARFMLPGNVYNFGAGMPALLRLDTPQRPTTTKGRQRCEFEAEIAERAARGRLQGVVIRAGDFYGSGSGSWLDLVIAKGLARGRLVYPGPLDLAHAWAYLPDLAQAFERVASRAGTEAFESLHFEGHTLTGRELLALIETAAGDLGVHPARGWRHGNLPWGLIRVGGMVYPLWRELARMSYLWRVPHALDGSALAAAVGPLPTTPPMNAMRQTLIALGLAAKPAPVPAQAGRHAA